MNILLVDDDVELLEKLKSDLNEKFEVVGTATNGRQGLELINSLNPDVAIVDLIMPEADGYWLLENMNASCHTKIIILSALSKEGFIVKATRLGAVYYIIKPYDKDVLYNRILELPQKNIGTLVRSNNKSLEEKITNIFITVGIPAHIKGYKFLREAIKLAIDNPSIVNSITKKLYPVIADKFSTSASKVERSIRHAIEVAWNKGRIENINTLFGVKVYSNKDRPTNGEFIALVADKMLLEVI
ncbi:MAG: sporulation transcription factor Spo0A [Clostridiales bacterium]|jgi:two-component system response regulator (stage 0 sporulation protein A)|nr:sporulation transcription factor Spo0A [Clostridiales bacterium]